MGVFGTFNFWGLLYPSPIGLGVGKLIPSDILMK